MFDAYRINKVFIRAMPKYDTYQIQPLTSTGGKIPQIVDIVDYDDKTTLSYTVDYFKYGNHRIHRGVQDWTRKFTPAIASTIFQNQTTSAYTQKFKQWIDAQYPTVPHYGYKLQISGETSENYALELICTLYFSCRQTR